ncbi:Zinc-binding alcohol dehydrogenase domain-containing protein cipB [Trametes pubescens]|uniref:Zinc-binding alcohol dehydrogenase domain-containing protein cipB n=1 Tax=Trametes pubescens TaxID=154538 RepID=A0A1M2W546_TRAPU|nr:Zinc-binding alcohol dehydrogenase domain-containing protein cipB [Trametes pubescens]
MSTPTQQNALLLLAKQGDFAVQTRPVPSPGPGELLVRNEASGLNPVDWKIQAYGLFIKDYPAVLGTDAAGVIVAVGEGVPTWKVGDKVLYEGRRPNDRATFQKYALVDADFVSQIPDTLTFEQAASIPLALTTAAVGLYNQAGGPRFTPPWVEGSRFKYAGPMVVIGGSSVVGSLALQLSRLSGFSPIITTASLKNAELLTGFGATHVLDRNLSASALREQVFELAGGAVPVVYDAISLPDTQNAAFDLLGKDGKLLTLLAPAVDEDKQKNANGRTVVSVAGHILRPENQDFGRVLFSKLTGLLKNGDLKPLHVDIIPGGLAGIPIGLDKLKNNQVSASKVVVQPQETA